MITYNEYNMAGLGFKLGKYMVLVYWYKPKNRPHITVKNAITSDYWRI